MAQYTNQAQLSYNGTVVNSNIAVGEIVGTLTAAKTAIRDTYSRGDSIAYVVSIVNTGSAVSGLSLTDNLGEYTFDENTLFPLTYTEGSTVYFVNGVLQPTPTVTYDGNELIITGISIPANGNAIIVYETVVNSFAPLNENGEIINTVTVSGMSISTITAEETITAVAGPLLTITKSISPVPVEENGRVTYNFLIQNLGNADAVATDNIVLTDVFNPILTDIAVSYNGTPWTEGVEYTYNEATGVFSTTQSAITVPSAIFTQDPTTGEWQSTPGAVSLTVIGTIIS
ncbi:MAG: hypothetical protein IJX51_03540 [Clostridia bacterium]|nr:hypothetical protein [Clostridia bacterium]